MTTVNKIFESIKMRTPVEMVSKATVDKDMFYEALAENLLTRRSVQMHYGTDVVKFKTMLKSHSSLAQKLVTHYDIDLDDILFESDCKCLEERTDVEGQVEVLLHIFETGRTETLQRRLTDKFYTDIGKRYTDSLQLFKEEYIEDDIELDELPEELEEELQTKYPDSTVVDSYMKEGTIIVELDTGEEVSWSDGESGTIER